MTCYPNPMAAMNISLTDELREFIDQRVDSGEFGTPTEYMRHLIRLDKEREAQRRLEQALLKGIESGPSVEFSQRDWDELRRSLLEKAAVINNDKKSSTKCKAKSSRRYYMELFTKSPPRRLGSDPPGGRSVSQEHKLLRK